MDPNTSWVLEWMDRMMKKTDMCGAVFPEVLAYVMKEEGNDSPSNEAVNLARKWEADPSLILAEIRKSHRWCMRPTWGCIYYCDWWRKEKREQ